MTAPESSGRASKIDTLIGIRGFAAIWVVLYHFRILLDYALPAPAWDGLRAIVHKGFLGLDLFSFLSGFVISMTYAERLCKPSLSSAARYLWLRIARIYPLIVFVLLLFVASHRWQSGAGHWREVWTNQSFWLQLLMLNGWGLESRWAWNVPSWSVSSEWLCYLLFPFAAPIVFRVKNAGVAISLALFTIIATGLAIKAMGKPYFGELLDTGVVRIGGEFLAGCWLHRAFSAGFGKRWPWGAIGSIAACAGVYLSTVDPKLAVFALAILVFALAHQNQPLAWIFANRVSVYLGEISYSLYLVHWFVVKDVKTLSIGLLSWLPLGAYVLLLLGLLFALSSMTYVCVERPARAWMRRRLGAWPVGETRTAAMG